PDLHVYMQDFRPALAPGTKYLQPLECDHVVPPEAITSPPSNPGHQRQPGLDQRMPQAVVESPRWLPAPSRADGSRARETIRPPSASPPRAVATRRAHATFRHAASIDPW